MVTPESDEFVVTDALPECVELGCSVVELVSFTTGVAQPASKVNDKMIHKKLTIRLFMEVTPFI